MKRNGSRARRLYNSGGNESGGGSFPFPLAEGGEGPFALLLLFALAYLVYVYVSFLIDILLLLIGLPAIPLLLSIKIKTAMQAPLSVEPALW